MDWLWWLGGALLLGVAEMFSLDLIFLMLVGTSFDTGTEVRVARIDGATAVVEAAGDRPATDGSGAPGAPAGI
jgi:membrane protein implicated in regulation of membrane protease activity